MKYERIASATGAGLSLLLLAGCGEQDSRNSDAVLPAIVAQEVGGRVMQLTYERTDKKIEQATAVRVSIGKGKTIDITAAHAVEKSADSCGDEQLRRKTNDLGVEYFSPIKQSPIEEYKQAVVQSTSQSPNLEGHDIVGMINDSDSDHYAGVRTESQLSINPGDTMVFVNYQKAPSGTSRDVERTDKYGEPAKFTGTYVGTEGTKLVALTGEGISYGSIDESVTRGGSSGGAAFIRGEGVSFAGITVASSNYEVSSEDIEQRFGTAIPVADGSRLTYIEPVTTDVAQELYRQAQQQPDCETSGY